MDWIDKMNTLGKSRSPFFFLISFDKSIGIVVAKEDLNNSIAFKINEIRHERNGVKKVNKIIQFSKNAIPYDVYEKAFEKVITGINYGDSYLVNLTMPSAIQCNLSLEEIYSIAHAKYKLLWKDKLCVFSPECFIKIIDKCIYSFPMKGTIDAMIENAESKLLHDEKEISEHYTIVDLIRNDLSQVAENVVVTKFRYIDTIHTHQKTLLQTSSEIKGTLAQNYNEHIGSIIDKLLPAGSISGAPKDKTLSIIKNAELDSRGFYTGIFGYFDGHNLDSGVAIRYIENNNGNFIYRSGGGITAMSTAESEYKELIDKVYVPTSRKHLD